MPEQKKLIAKQGCSGGEEKPLLPQSALRYRVACATSLTVVFLSGWILNVYIFPYYDGVLPWIREISTATNAVALILIALVATWKPKLVKGRAFVIATVFLLVVGIVLTGIGVALSGVFVLALGASLSALGRGVLSVLAGVSCVRLSIKELGFCVAGAYLLSYILRNVLSLLPEVVSLVLFAIAPLLAVSLVVKGAMPVLQKIQQSEAPAQKALTQPSSFLPFSHQLFVCLLLFRTAYGYAMTLGEVNGVPLATTAAIFPLALVVVLLFVGKNLLNPDRLFQASYLLVIAGFLLLTVPMPEKNAAVNTLLMAGVSCFDLLIWFVLIVLGSKNIAGSLSVFAWGLAMNSWGVIIGANLGRFTNAHYGLNSTIVSFIAIAVVFLFVAYAVVVLKNFSFKSTIESVLPERDPVINMESSILELRCTEIAARYGLTARESEVFALLARGRNGRFVQDELVVSYNTVKAHVKHIYAKIGLHTQQELIDLVEQKNK